MSATSYLVSVAGFVAAGTIVLSSVGHVFRLHALEDALREQRVVPSTMRKMMAIAVVAAETLIAAACSTAIVRGDPSALRLVFLTLVSLYAIYASYSAVLNARGISAPCGCSGTGTPVSQAVTFRAGVLGLAALVPTVFPHALDLPDPVGYESAVLVLSSLGLSVILWAFPAAMAAPGNEPSARSAS